MNTEKKNKLGFCMILLLLTAAYCAFIALLLRQPRAVEADLSALKAAFAAEGLTADMQEGTDRLLKRNFDLLPGAYEEVLYLAPVNFMDVGEVLVVRTSDASAQETVREAVEKRLQSQKNIFENYGTDQFSLLQAAQIYQNEKYICYAAGPHADELLRLVRGAIER